MRWLDVFLALFATGLIIAGPIMALQEVAAAETAIGTTNQDRARAQMLGEPAAPPATSPDTTHRILWVSVMPLVVVSVDALGLLTLLRVNVKRNVRAYARRPGLVLLGGMTLVTATYILDLTVFFGAAYFWRLLTVPWLYMLSGVLVVGSLYQIASLEETFAPASPLNIPNEAA